jgi:tetratricopeptide (TPR) repeat protein
MSKHSTVQIWAEDAVIPTYLVGEPNRNPMFLEKRVYQGSSGRVYPYPVIDKICDEPVQEKHRVVFLENQYLKLMVMPGFGGRIQYAYDKTNGYPFIYHNHIIKPALVGLAGPWLSGGIEFNWPQHHRPGTYCPVDYTITENPDGSQTLWLSEIEPMWHLKGTLGLTLFPDKSLLEINIRLFNPTPLPQSFHLWTNPAVHVNDHYQSVFPPDVQTVYDHGKRDVSAFPIARGEYYKVDYSRGVDISWYKNLPVPTSFMAARSAYNFIGGYDHHQQAGVLHVADHHFIPGKKQWVWGCGDFGLAWDRNLTDEDGPYAELMCGVFADNQPDFSWLQPFEEKEVKQFFLPYKAIGYVRNATIHAAVSLELAGGKAKVGAYATSPRPNATMRLCRFDKRIWQRRVDLGPEVPFVADVPLPKNCNLHDLRLEVLNAEGESLVAYTPEPKQAEAIPQPAQPIPQPTKVTNNEALYLAGLHLEQYRHATREPEDYYREALRRDPGDLRANHALGLLLLRRGQFAKAEPFFRAAIKTQTRHNPNPRDGEPHYHLGVCLRFLGRANEATSAFCKAAWNAAWQDCAFFQLAQLAASRFGVPASAGSHALRSEAQRTALLEALEHVERALARNAHNQKAAHLRILLLRKSGRAQEALQLADAALARDPLDFGARNERALLLSDQNGHAERTTLFGLMRDNAHTYLEIAADYAHAGAYPEAINLLQHILDATDHQSPTTDYQSPSPHRSPGHLGPAGAPNARPMLFYFMGYYAALQGDLKAATGHFKAAAAQPPDRCFPNSLDSLLALQTALKLNPRDAHAAFYLGNLLYDNRQVAEATTLWERSQRADRTFPTVHRNLALVYFNKQQKSAKALKAMEKAFALDRTDARVLFELDLLKKRAGVSPRKRLAFLATHRSVVDEREDLLLEYVTLLNYFGRYEEALSILMGRKFHPWEGGEGKTTGQYVVCRLEMAKALLLTGSAGPLPEELGDHQSSSRLGVLPLLLGRRGMGRGGRQSPAHEPRFAKELPTIPPLPFRRGEGRGEGSGGSLSAVEPAASQICVRARRALELLERARTYPQNLGEGKLQGAQENQLLYWLGVAHDTMGEREAARRCWEEAATGMKVPSPAIYYNDQNPDTIFYQGLALRKLGRRAAAKQRFETLVKFGRQHLRDHITIDYFAVSLPEFLVFDDDLDRRNQINCRYLMALGFFGLGRRRRAFQELTSVLRLDPAHLPAQMHLHTLQRFPVHSEPLGE